MMNSSNSGHGFLKGAIMGTVIGASVGMFLIPNQEKRKKEFAKNASRVYKIANRTISHLMH